MTQDVKPKGSAMRIAVVATIAVIVALILLLQSVFTVDVTQQALVLQFGRYVRTVNEPGLHFKVPFYQQATRYEKRVLTSDVSPGEYLTLDKKRLVTDPISRWRIADPLQFFKTVNNEAGALGRLEPIILSELRDELAKHNFANIISYQREAITDTVSGRVRAKATEFGIEVLDVRIQRADLPTEVQASVFARMKAERGRIALGYRAEGNEQAAKVRAEADKQATIILAEAYAESQKLKGEGDAQATAIYAQAFEQDAEFYGFLRTLEAYQKFLGQQTTLVLGSDTELFRYLASSEVPLATDK
ncbi:MAG: protease modulator HflC [Chloroflexota bacterium]|nr:protease modulator HflC [Chloroflexota bacterium]